jgi:hypothetical protein
MMRYESLELLGSPFKIVDTYVYDEGPQTFAMRSVGIPDLYYFVNTVDEDDDTLTALAVAVSGDRYRAVRSGLVEFRDAFTRAGARALTSITWSWSSGSAEPIITMRIVSGMDLSDDWLPVGGVRLDLRTDTLPAYDEAELVSLSQAQNRTVFALEVGAGGRLTSELPLRAAGELQGFLNGGVEALARSAARRAKKTAQASIRPVKGSTQSRVVAEFTPLSLGTRAASYVFVMAIDSGGALEATEVTTAAFEDLNGLVRAVNSENSANLLAAMRRHPARVRSNFRHLLTALTGIDSGLTVAASIAHSNSIIRSTATASQVRSASDAIKTAKPKLELVEVRRGVLTGHILASRTFVLTDLASGITYRGHMEEEAALQANGLPVGDSSFVSGRVRVEIPFAADEDESGRTYVLETLASSDI